MRILFYKKLKNKRFRIQSKKHLKRCFLINGVLDDSATRFELCLKTGAQGLGHFRFLKICIEVHMLKTVSVSADGYA